MLAASGAMAGTNAARPARAFRVCRLFDWPSVKHPAQFKKEILILRK